MKAYFKKLLCLILCVTLLVPVSLSASAEGVSDTQNKDISVTEFFDDISHEISEFFEKILCSIKGEEYVKISKSSFSCQRDGLTIRGSEYRPEGDNLPAVIVSHQFMTNSKAVAHYAKTLARMGYAAYCFDFCGGCVALGKSDGKTTDMSVLTEAEDLKAVVEYVKALPYTDSSSISLMGCSQGGFVSAITADELKEEISKLVLFYPALCIPDDAKSGKMMLAKFDPQNIPETIYCGPMKLGRCYVEDVINMDPFEEIAEYPGDVLIVHGTKDSVVDLSYAQNALEAYNSRKEGSAELKIIEGGTHIFSSRHDKIATEYLREFMSLN